MMLVGVTVAAGVAAVTVATNMRDRIDETDLAAEIANDVLQRAEAFGCGLPIGYNEVGAADRLAACDYVEDGEVDGDSGLADVDFTAARGDRRFDVSVRMEWNLAPPVPPGYLGSGSFDTCRRQAEYANGDASDPVNSLADPAGPSQPTVLTRTVEVVSEDGRTVTLTSRQAVLPHLAPAGATLGLMVSETGLEGGAATLERTIDGTAYSYTLHGDPDDCAWFPYLEGVTYTLKVAGQDDRAYRPLTCPTESTGPCHQYVSS